MGHRIGTYIVAFGGGVRFAVAHETEAVAAVAWDPQLCGNEGHCMDWLGCTKMSVRRAVRTGAELAEHSVGAAGRRAPLHVGVLIDEALGDEVGVLLVRLRPDNKSF